MDSFGIAPRRAPTKSAPTSPDSPSPRMVSASRSLMLPLGLRNSHLAWSVRPSGSNGRGTSGVFPMSDRMGETVAADGMIRKAGMLAARAGEGHSPFGAFRRGNSGRGMRENP